MSYFFSFSGFFLMVGVGVVVSAVFVLAPYTKTGDESDKAIWDEQGRFIAASLMITGGLMVAIGLLPLVARLDEDALAGVFGF